MPSFLIYTLGCKLNQLESEAIDEQLTKNLNLRFREQRAEDEEQLIESGLTDSPSIIIINTCTVTSKADQKARRVIRKALRDYPEAVVIVTGCYAQLNKDDILKLSGDDKRQRLFVINKENVLDFISSYNDLQSPVPSPRLPIPDSRPSAPDSQFQFNPQRFSSHTRSFLKIQDGCDKHCTYCKIRLARGPSISLDAKEVLSRLRILEQHHAEAVLTGVNISQYRDFDFFYHEPHEQIRTEEKKGGDLAELLDYLLSNTSKIAIRLSSLAPESVDEKLANVLTHPRIRPHFHLSIQSGSQKILERMGRSYDAGTIERAAALLRGAKDDPFLACDIITGFPGETDADFEETFSLCKKLDFAWIHVFPYSKRAGTPAFSFKDTVRESDVTKRVQSLTKLAEQGKARYVERWLGREVEVIAMNNEQLKNNEQGAAFCRGISENYLKTLVQYDEDKNNEDKKPLPGTVLKCRLIKSILSDDYDVQGEIQQSGLM